MALAMADSLANGFDVSDQLSKYCDWYETGKYSVNDRCFDIGNTTQNALWRFQACNDNVINNVGDEWSGNGGIMRLAPAVIKYLDQSPHQLAEYAALSSMTTHASPSCCSCAVYMACLMQALALGVSKEEALTLRLWKGQNIFIEPDVENIIENDSKKPVGSGYVVDSLHAALWAFSNHDTFEDVVLAAVNLGDDSDTTGAVAGQLAGAYWGYDGIPSWMLEGLAKKEMIDLYLDPIL
jgi:ADP-ribosylglycohydrolase